MFLLMDDPNLVECLLGKKEVGQSLQGQKTGLSVKETRSNELSLEPKHNMYAIYSVKTFSIAAPSLEDRA